MENRLHSLDIFRGITIAFMIIVNTPGDWSIAYNMLEHAQWHGFTPTDLVFPSFVFITGVSSWFSYRKYSHTLTSDLTVKIIKRTLVLFALGVLLYAFPYYNKPLSTWRILGVLQRIALCYGIGSLICLSLNKKQIIGLSITILLGYWLILTQFGDLTIENNAVRQLDIALFGELHLWNGNGIRFDPEGLLSTLPALVNFMIGYLVGQYLSQAIDKKEIAKELALWGIGLAIIACVWHFAFPLNKKLWTSSFVLLTSGLSTIIFAGVYHLVDVQGNKSWGKFFTVLGTNAILAYLISEFLILALSEFIRVKEAQDIVIDGHELTYRYGFTFLFGRNDFSSFLYALVYMLVCWLIVYVFYKKNIFLKV